MGVALIVTGLLMNIVGVALSSSRDLKALGRTVGSVVAARFRRVMSWLRRGWTRLRGLKVDSQVQSVSGSGSVASGAYGTAFAWNPAPDGMDLETAIQRFRDRTDNLHDMVKFESERRVEEDGRISQRLEELATGLAASVAQLEERVDDFDVKPAGQRAIGALLIVCGTILMFVGSFLG